MTCKYVTTMAAVLADLCVVLLQPSAAFAWPVQDPSQTIPTEDFAELTLSTEKLSENLPDIEPALELAQKALDQAKSGGDDAGVAYYTSVLERVKSVQRPRQVKLTLEDVVRRTLANNFTIQTISYNPAIETTRIVEAESRFDAVWFGSINRSKLDQPTAISLSSTDRETVDLSTGVRKLLPLGTTITGQFGLNRTRQTFEFQDQSLNPAYTTSLSLDIRQPMLRGFGLDYNRSAIVVARNNRRVSYLQFRRQIMDILRDLEERYWRLVQARRDVVISANELADFEKIYQYLLARKDFDILPVNIFAARADLEQVKADFVQRRATLFDAEDRLIALMNDPEITLEGGIECIPTDFPTVERMVVQPLAEVQSALNNRTEIKEQEVTVENAKVVVGQALNQEMPKADLAITATVHGLGPDIDHSVSQAEDWDFISYTVGVDLEIPIGNRGPRAVRRRAQLEHQKAIAALRDTLERIILEVNLAVRSLDTAYDQIQPNYASMEARKRELDSIVARAERKDYGTLTSELNAWRALASTRRSILNAVVNHNVAIAELERSKGTLLKYDNVVIPDDTN